MNATMANKKVLVTGGFGFVGNSLIRKLSGSGADISILSNVPGPENGKYRSFIGDLKDREFVGRVVSESGPDCVLHLAADKNRSSRIEDFRSSIDNNLTGSLNLFEALIATGKAIPTVVIGTAEEYGNVSAPFGETKKESPMSSYSFSKTCLTLLCGVLHKLYPFPYVVLRPSIAYGPGQGTEMFIPALIRSLSENRRFDMTPGNQKRDFVFVEDLTDAILTAALTEKSYGKIINIGSGKPVTILRLAKMIAQKMKKEELLGIGALPYRKSEIMNYTLDVSSARRHLGWSAKTSLAEGLDITINKDTGKAS